MWPKPTIREREMEGLRCLSERLERPKAMLTGHLFASGGTVVQEQ
jgi:hypothetical protein